MLLHSTRKTLLILTILAFSIVFAVSVLAVDDGRINVAAHAGGNAIYCIDENGAIAGSYMDGGIEVVDPDGQQVMFISGDVLSNLVERANNDTLLQNTLVESASGIYGELGFWVLENGRFELTGFDEYGKRFAFDWRGCQPVRPPAPIDDDGTGDPLITPEPVPVEPPVTEEVPLT